MKDFKYWKKLHESEKLEEFSQDKTGLLWLKTKSIVRKELMADFLKNSNIQLTETALEKQFVELFDLLCFDVAHANQKLNEFIKIENEKQVDLLNTTQLVSELYKLKNFD